MTAFSLRPTVAGDLGVIQRIYAHHVLTGLASFEETPPDIDELTRRWRSIAEMGLPYVVAEGPGGEIAGYAYASPYRPRSAYRFTVEDSIYLDPAFQGQGLGRALLARLIADATACGKRQMIAVIGDSANAASIGVHRALGFEMTGTFKGIGRKFGRWVDTVLMQRALGDGVASTPTN
ncbi:GNAT family N-acetyltransferase [Dongia rigui]|uniref:GNAT family N-acetyltransferase n=1 Tax=Dongia rigui TaxID=940149 RepID=A0ABU5DZD5_9PROT|nr:N-acetyltransferase family protein [Dongia rigui]MDY0872666.1 GNAT family N-acetyltransferase [Dongia rigui]